jgi:hypothetical protein
MEAAQRRLEQAQADDVQEALGHDAWVAMLAERRRAVDAAAATLGVAEAELRQRDDQADISSVMEDYMAGTPGERRELLARFFDLFAVTRGKDVLVYPRGSAPDDLPRQGRPSVGLRPLPDADFDGLVLLPREKAKRSKKGAVIENGDT